MTVRVAILGNAGSGKSTLARALAVAAGVPYLDLDSIAWEADRPAVARTEELARGDVHAFCRGNGSWVVEGCYATLIEVALSYGPALILLNPGREVCLANCRSRPWEPHKYASKEEQDENLQFLLSWVEDYYTRSDSLSLTAHLACLAGYKGPKRVLQSLPDVQDLDPALLAWVRGAFAAGRLAAGR